jgi:chromate transporter
VALAPLVTGAPSPPAEEVDRLLGPRGWLLLNLKVGAFSFGTGSVAPVYRRALVEETRALSAEEFQDLLTIAQLLPGPNLVSLSMALGSRLFGHAVGAMGVAALCLPGAAWALVTTALVPIDEPLVRAAVAGFAVGAALLLLELSLQLERGLRRTHVSGEAASRARHGGRLGVALAVAASSITGVPLLTTVMVGVVAGVAVEMAT